MLRLPDPSLVVLVGASASGKSTWAAEHFRPEQIVSSDRLRAVVGEAEHDQAAGADAFAVLDQIVKARVKRRLTTVIDTLGMNPELRHGWRDLAAHNGLYSVVIFFDTPAAECRRRNAARAFRVPVQVLRRQLSEFAATLPTLNDDGFDEVTAARPVRVVTPQIAAAARAVLATASPEASVAEDPSATAGRSGLRFGLQLSSVAGPGGPATLADRLTRVATEAEAAGFSSLWVMDHFRQIPQLGPAWEDMPESTAVLGYLAAATKTASIGCLVNCVTYRNLAHLAKIVATLDVLSGGRAWCGLGAGWFEAEHAAYGWSFPPTTERLDLLEDALRLLPLMWGPGTPAFKGLRIQVPEAMCYPRPLRSPVPVLVGGSGERRTLRLVAKYADACNLTGDVDVVRHKIDVLRAHCADVGRDPSAVEVTHLSTALVAADPAELDKEVTRRQPSRNRARWASRVNPGTIEDHVLRARALHAAGVQNVIVSLEGIWDSAAITRFAAVIAASTST